VNCFTQGRRKKMFLCSLAMLFLAMVALVACAENEEDEDASSPEPQNGWSDGCNWEYDGSQKATAADDDCLPPDPGNDNYDMLAKIIEAYGGAYTDQNGREVLLTCRPEGEWVVPEPIEDARCAYSWVVPLWVEFVDTGEIFHGAVNQNYDSLKLGASLWYFVSEEITDTDANRFGDFSGDWYWKFASGDRWTKTD
jgi:hypothetical protein